MTPPPFAVEEIPDEHVVFRRVYKGYIAKNGSIKINAFGDPPPRQPGERVGLSVLWERYASPKDCKCTGKSPEENGVAQMLSGEIRGVDSLLVEHDPKDNLQAHSQIYGQKDEEVRIQLARIAKLVLHPG